MSDVPTGPSHDLCELRIRVHGMQIGASCRETVLSGRDVTNLESFQQCASHIYEHFRHCGAVVVQMNLRERRHVLVLLG